MSLVVASLSHSSTGGLSPGSSDTVSASSSAGKKRKRDEDKAGVTPPPLPLPTSLLFPLPLNDGSISEKPVGPMFDPTVAMLAAASMFDAQALRSVDAWFGDINKHQQQLKQQKTVDSSEDMVKTASDILRSFVEHKLTSSASGSDTNQQTEGGEQLPRRHSTPSKVVVGEGRGEEKTVECSDCGKAFKSKTDLARHIDNDHSAGGAKMFKCDECPYETRHQSNLSVHRRTHTGE